MLINKNSVKIMIRLFILFVSEAAEREFVSD